MILLSLFILVSYTSIENWSTYSDNINHFSISYPEGWTKQKTNGSIAFLSAKESSKDVFCENVNLMLQDLSQQPMTLEQDTNLTQKQVIENPLVLVCNEDAMTLAFAAPASPRLAWVFFNHIK